MNGGGHKATGRENPSRNVLKSNSGKEGNYWVWGDETLDSVKGLGRRNRHIDLNRDLNLACTAKENQPRKRPKRCQQKFCSSQIGEDTNKEHQNAKVEHRN